MVQTNRATAKTYSTTPSTSTQVTILDNHQYFDTNKSFATTRKATYLLATQEQTYNKVNTHLVHNGSGSSRSHGFIYQ